MRRERRGSCQRSRRSRVNQSDMRKRRRFRTPSNLCHRVLASTLASRVRVACWAA